MPTGKPTKPAAANNKGNSSDSDDEDTTISRPKPHTVGTLGRQPSCGLYLLASVMLTLLSVDCV